MENRISNKIKKHPLWTIDTDSEGGGAWRNQKVALITTEGSTNNRLRSSIWPGRRTNSQCAQRCAQHCHKAGRCYVHSCVDTWARIAVFFSPEYETVAGVIHVDIFVWIEVFELYSVFKSRDIRENDLQTGAKTTRAPGLHRKISLIVILGKISSYQKSNLTLECDQCKIQHDFNLQVELRSHIIMKLDWCIKYHKASVSG